MSALRLERVVKSFAGRRALDDLSVEVPDGVLSGLVGPNGSGKTTLMSVVAGLLRPDSGRVDVCGRGPFDPRRSAGLLSLMPQDSLPSQHLSILQSLCYYGRLQGASAREARRDAERWLREVDLAERASARFAELSHGMKRRFSVAQAFLGTPRLVLLDEPTAGLDPAQVARLREVFLAQRGARTLIVSSHVLSELEEICDHVVILDRGRRVRQGSLSQLGEQGAAELTVKLVAAGALDCESLERELPEGFRLSWRSPVLTVRHPAALGVEEANAAVLPALLKRGLGILAVAPGASLEQRYLEATKPSRR